MELTPEVKLAEIGIHLPDVSDPTATYLKWRKTGNLIYLAGHVSEAKGKLGRDLTTEEGYQAARSTGIAILTTLKDAVGDLSRISQFVMVHGMVNCMPDFQEHPKVINGFSDFMIEIFGEKGKHARSAIGHAVLPFEYSVEIELIVEVED
jgi:enamine deaminase RidA (YjgF/YER057c/UK114 family)